MAEPMSTDPAAPVAAYIAAQDAWRADFPVSARKIGERIAGGVYADDGQGGTIEVVLTLDHLRDLLAEVERQADALEKRRQRLVAAEADLLNIRGTLCPPTSLNVARVPMELGLQVTPAVEWLLADWWRLKHPEWASPCAITTVEQLRALPTGTVLHDSDTGESTEEDLRLPTVWQIRHCRDGSYTTSGGAVYWLDHDDEMQHLFTWGPFTVLWLPPRECGGCGGTGVTLGSLADMCPRCGGAGMESSR